METKVCIIGAGPAGIACAIQLKRQQVPFCIIEKNKIGGLLLNANLVENYPGFPSGISGKQLSSLFEKQLNQQEIDIVNSEVKSINFENDIFNIETKEQIISCSILVVATGTLPLKDINIKVDEEISHKIHYDLSKFNNVKNKIIGIIGAGDAAFDYAINLSKNNKVNIFNRSSETKCLELLYKRLLEIDNFKYHTNHALISIQKNEDQILLTFSNLKVAFVDELIFAIGRKENISYISESIKMIETELIEKSKLFVIGDVKNGNFRQTSISVGDGVRAAMEIANQIQK